MKAATQEKETEIAEGHYPTNNMMTPPRNSHKKTTTPSTKAWKCLQPQRQLEGISPSTWNREWMMGDQ